MGLLSWCCACGVGVGGLVRRRVACGAVNSVGGLVVGGHRGNRHRSHRSHRVRGGGCVG